MQYVELHKLLKGRRDTYRISKFRAYVADCLMQISGGLNGGRHSVLIWIATLKVVEGHDPKTIIDWADEAKQIKRWRLDYADKHNARIRPARIALIIVRKLLRRLAIHERFSN